jgi:hypothetical protein
MKIIDKIFIGLFSICLMLSSCSDGIDPITPVEAGADAAAPQVNILSPIEGSTIKVLEEVSTVNIKFEVVDDIEVANIQVAVDGNTVASMNEFLDYRVVKDEVIFDNVINGEHTVTVTATDLDGNTTTKTVNFSKEPPYTPRFANEYLYMSFDGDYTDLLSLRNATQVGMPGFTEDAFLGGRAYQGAEESYVTLPFDGESLGQEFTVFFWYKFNPDPDRGGILVMQPEGASEPTASSGFRLFREISQGEPTIKLNVGTGNSHVWNDGESIAAYEGEWMNVAVTVSTTATKIYFNGVLQKEASLAEPIDWSGANLMSIMSGAPRFTQWDHLSDESAMDELRIFDAALSQEEIQALIGASAETLYMPFDTGYDDLIANREVTVVGSPGFAGESVEGSNAYAGAEDSYLTLPSAGLTGESFSATMWYKLNADPNRAGILVIGPEDPDNAGYPETQNNRTSGFRFFRENGAAGHQRFKLNVGDGTADTWVDGQTDADVPNDAGWVHLAFTISPTTAIVYINGVAVKESTFSGIDWSGSDILSIMSGAPRFTGYNHWSDLSYLDELRFYNKALTQEEIEAAMGE